jgi:hypothetical protein
MEKRIVCIDIKDTVETPLPLSTELSTLSFVKELKKIDEFNFLVNIKKDAEKLYENECEGLPYINDSKDKSTKKLIPSYRVYK